MDMQKSIWKNLGHKPEDTLLAVQCRPMISYASSAWWKKTQQKKAHEKFRKVQRFAC